MTKTNFQNDAIFWIEVDKITPNPYQPRKEFTEAGLRDLAESIRMYGILQPLTVTRREVATDIGMSVEYELIAGERRLRASKLAGLVQVPVIIRSGPENSRVKLELAIIENLQREDLNPIDRALAFKQLAEEFEFTHSQIAKKVGKSREYVSNSIRLLQLPEEIQGAIVAGKISEGHARPLGMLRDKPDEQSNVFKEVVLKKLTVRETEKIARGIAKDKVRKKDNMLGPDLERMQKELSQTLGTRVHIEPKEVGGKLVIDYFSKTDVEHFLQLVSQSLLTGKVALDSAQEAVANFDDVITSVKDDKSSNSNVDKVSVEVPDNLPTDEPGDKEDDIDTKTETVKDDDGEPVEYEDPFSYLDEATEEPDDKRTSGEGEVSAYNPVDELLKTSPEPSQAADTKPVDDEPVDESGLKGFSL